MTPTFIVSIVTACLLTAVYLPAVMGHQWLMHQDPFFITQNPAVIAGQSIWNVSLQQHVWMPLTLLIYRLQFLVAELNPVVFHLTNVCVFVLGVVFVLLIAIRLKLDRRLALLGALVYGFLPLHTSSIASASGLMDLLANMFLPLAILALIKFRSKGHKRWLITLIVALICLGLTKHPLGLLKNMIAMVAACLSMGFAFALVRFDEFLKTQEKIIRYLLWVAVVGMLLMLALMAFERCSWWKNDLSLARNMARIEKTPVAYLRLASVMRQELTMRNANVNTQAIEEIYKKVLTLDAKNPSAYIEYAAFLIQIKRLTEARAILEQLLTIVPKHPQALLGLAELSLIEHKTDSVIQLVNDLIKAFPDNEDVYLKTVVLYSRAVVMYPKEIIFKEKREELLDDLDELSKRKNYTAIDFYNLALLYQQIGGVEESMRYYQKALQRDPNHQASLYNLALLTQATGDLKGALGLYERLAKSHPKFAMSFLNMGLIYNSMGEAVKAKQMYRKTIEVAPDNSMAYYHLGYLMENEQDYKSATDNYEKAVELDPSNSEAYYNLGNVYAQQNLDAEAIAAYLKTVELNPKHMNAYVNLSIMSYKARDVQGALKYLKKAQALGYVAPEKYLKTLEPYKK